MPMMTRGGSLNIYQMYIIDPVMWAGESGIFFSGLYAGDRNGGRAVLKIRRQIIHGILVVVCVAGLAGCSNSKYRYEETMNSEILDFGEYQTAVDYYNAQNYKEAILYYGLTLDRIKDEMQPGTTMEYWIKGQMGDCYMRMGELDKADTRIQEAKEGLEKKDEAEMLSTIYQLEGEYYEMLEQYDTAIICYEKALKNAESEEILRLYRLMGDVYAEMDMGEKALEYYDYAIEIGEKQNNAAGLANVYYRKGIFYSLAGELEDAKECFEIGTEYAEYYWKVDDIKVAEGYTYLARVCFLDKNYGTAYLYSRKAMDIYNSQDSDYTYDSNITTIYSNMGHMNTKLGNYDVALKMTKKAFDITVANMETDTWFVNFYNTSLLYNLNP